MNSETDQEAASGFGRSTSKVILVPVLPLVAFTVK